MKFKITHLICFLLMLSCSDTNVSYDEKLVNQMAEMEYQMQAINITQLDIGSSYFSEIKNEFEMSSRDSESRANKLRLVYDKTEEINDLSIELLILIESYKFELLKNAGENINLDERTKSTSILWRKMINEPEFYPAKLNLSAVKNKSQTKAAEKLFLTSNKSEPSENGLKLWNMIQNYRLITVQNVGSYQLSNKTYKINPNSINDFGDLKDLELQLSKMVDKSDANLKEERQVLIDIYSCVSYPERIKTQGAEVHWISAKFNNATIISAIASLTALQNDILSARTMAFAHWKSKVSSCGYGFDSIIPFAIGPSTMIEGQEGEIQVMVVAFDSNNLPSVTVTDNEAKITVTDDSRGLIRIKPKVGLQKFKGTVSIKNQSGIAKTEHWEWTINVLPKKPQISK